MAVKGRSVEVSEQIMKAFQSRSYQQVSVESKKRQGGHCLSGRCSPSYSMLWIRSRYWYSSWRAADDGVMSLTPFDIGEASKWTAASGDMIEGAILSTN